MASARYISSHFTPILNVTEDSPNRNFGAYDTEDLSIATLEAAEGPSNLSDSDARLGPSNSLGTPKSNQTPRREVWWLDQSGTNQNLESIKRCFEKRLDRPRLSSSNSL